MGTLNTEPPVVDPLIQTLVDSLRKAIEAYIAEVGPSPEFEEGFREAAMVFGAIILATKGVSLEDAKRLARDHFRP